MANKNKSGNKTYLADKETLDSLYDDIGDLDDTDGGYGFGTINAKLNYIINYKLGEAGGGVLETISILPSQSNTLEYNGQMQSPTWNNYNPNKLDIGGTLEAHNAGEYKAAFVPKVGYKWENADTIKNISWFISGTEIALPTVTNAMTYNGSEQSPTWSGYDSSKMSIGGVTKATDAGNYNTTFLPLTGCVWPDGTSEMKSVQWSIAKAQGSLSIDKTEASLNPSNLSIIINVTKVGDGQLTAVSSNTNVCTTSISGNQVTVTYVNGGDATVTIGLLEGKNYTSAQSKIVNITSVSLLRFGVKINKNNSDPYNRVEYLYDAVGMTPAKMNYSTGVFDYGSWGDVWFVKDNKPVMLKQDGTEDYELDPNDYEKKIDGTPSDIHNGAYTGNAMARIPLCYLYMYEDDNYEYIIASNDKYDDNYKAYAHTRGDGTIAQNMYISIFRLTSPRDSSTYQSLCVNGSGANYPVAISNKIRGGINSVVKNNENIDTNNRYTGNKGYYLLSWSQHNLINSLLTIISKSDNSQVCFGNGFESESNNPSDDIKYSYAVGAGINKGQFWGSNTYNTVVKTFHIENWWGSYEYFLVGIFSYVYYSTYGYYISCYKMYPPYTQPNISSNNYGDYYSNYNQELPVSFTTLGDTNKGTFIVKTQTGDYGRMPLQSNSTTYSTDPGSASKYCCDQTNFIVKSYNSSSINSSNANTLRMVLTSGGTGSSGQPGMHHYGIIAAYYSNSNDWNRSYFMMSYL